MFTGIIDHCGILIKIEKTPAGLRLSIKHGFQDLSLGESISIDGICLTVTAFQEGVFCCDVSPETLNVTTAKDFQVGDQLNVERALLLSSRLGGHVVTGHVDQTVTVIRCQSSEEYIEMQFSGLTEKTKNFVIKKGSVCINGVSLTVNEVFEKGFSVMLIPHTLSVTNLKNLQEKDEVNIEFDMMARIIVEQCQHYLANMRP